jgi:hypothetical protein
VGLFGKDYVAGYVCTRFFSRYAHLYGGCRVVTTSVRDDHLRVLWGEISRFIQLYDNPFHQNPKLIDEYGLDMSAAARDSLIQSPRRLDVREGGSLLILHRDIRHVLCTGRVHPTSYMIGITSKMGEGMAGHHAAHTLFVGDEASGISDIAYEQARGWLKRSLIFGNPNDCQNFYRKAVEGGDILVGQRAPEALTPDIEMDFEDD